MIITHGKMKHELFDLLDMYKKLFINKVQNNLFTSIYDKFCLYIFHNDDQELLEDFVKEYFKLRGIVVDNRNTLIDQVQSNRFKTQNFLNRIRIKQNLNYWQKMCDNINKFEREFFKRTNISLLRVENERWAREQGSKKEVVEQ